MDLMDIRRRLLAQIRGTAMELIKTYTVQESWENDNLGNTNTIIDTIFSERTIGGISDIYFMRFDNNQALRTAYKTDGIVLTPISTDSYRGYVIRNNKTETRTNSTNTSSWASIGTIIKIYKIKLFD